MSWRDKVSALRRDENAQKAGGQPTDKTDTTPFVSFGSAMPPRFANEIPAANEPDADAQQYPEPWPEPQLDPQDLTHARLIGMGLDDPEATDLAAWMTLRDVSDDDRITCFECSHFRPTGRRCGNYVQAEMPRELGLELATMRQRCVGFRPGRRQCVQPIFSSLTR